MIKILAALALLIVAQPLWAQQTKQFMTAQPCDNVLSITETITKKYGEQPLFVGNGNQLSASDGNWYSSSMMYFVNQDSGTWSLVSLYSDGTACMVAAGTNFEPYID